MIFGSGRGCGLVALVEAGHLALGFAQFNACLEVVALVAVGFTAADAEFGFHLAVFPVETQQGQGKTLLSLLDFQFEDFALVHQQAARPFCFVLEPLAGGFPGLDIAAVEEKLPFFHAGERVSDVDPPLTDGFDLCAAQLDTALMLAEDFVIPACFLVAGYQVVLRCGLLGHVCGGAG